MTPAQVAELRQEAARLTTGIGPTLLRGLGPSGSLIRASLRAMGLDSTTLFQLDPLADVPDGAVATLAALLYRRLGELGAGDGPEPSEEDRAAALAAIRGD